MCHFVVQLYLTGIISILIEGGDVTLFFQKFKLVIKTLNTHTLVILCLLNSEAEFFDLHFCRDYLAKRKIAKKKTYGIKTSAPA